MFKDGSMEWPIALLESKVDDLAAQVAEIRRDYATKSDIANLQKQIDGLGAELHQMRVELEARFLRLEDRMTKIEERLSGIEQLLARFEQRPDSELLHFVTKAELRKQLLVHGFTIITVQSAINAAMIAAVVQFLR